MAEHELFLVTGASGGIGAWAVKHLLEAGVAVTALINGDDDDRLRLITEPDQLASLTSIRTSPDYTDKICAAVHDATHVVHTEAVTEEDCALDPGRCAELSVGRLVAVLSAAEDGRDRGIVFQSSMSVFGPATGTVDDLTSPAPMSLRGCLHLANEVIAARWLREAGVASVGLRPNLVYGPGQDTGTRGASTRAIAAAVDDRPAHLGYTGLADFQYVSDVALAFIAAARVGTTGHRMVNLHGHPATFSAFAQSVVALTGAGNVSPGTAVYPVPITAAPAVELDSDLSRLGTRLDEGIRATLETFRWAPRDLYWHGCDRDDQNID